MKHFYRRAFKDLIRLGAANRQVSSWAMKYSVFKIGVARSQIVVLDIVKTI